MTKKIKQIVIFDEFKNKSIEIVLSDVDSHIVVKLIKLYDKKTIKQEIGWENKDFRDVSHDPYRIQQILDLYAADIHREVEKLKGKTLKRVDKGDRGIIIYDPIQISTTVEESFISTIKNSIEVITSNKENNFAKILEKRILLRILSEAPNEN